MEYYSCVAQQSCNSHSHLGMSRILNPSKGLSWLILFLVFSFVTISYKFFLQLLLDRKKDEPL